MDDQGTVKSPGTSSTASSKKKKGTSTEPKPQTSKSASEKPTKSQTSSKTHRSSADSRINELDQKWSERFNRLEAILLAKTIDKPEPGFTTFKVTPTHSPPTNSAISKQPFIKPHKTDSSGTDLASQRQASDQSQASDLLGSSQTVSKSASKSSKVGKASTDLPPDQAGTDSPISQQVPSRSSSVPTRRQSVSSMDTDSDSDYSDRPPVDLFAEEVELSEQELEASITDPEFALSEEQTYRETMSGIRSFMGWSYIPEIDTATSKAENNPFAGPKPQSTGKVSVTMPTDEWLCCKLGKLNLTLTEGYPSHSSEAGGLLKDKFVRPPKSQAKWYQFVPNQPKTDQDSSNTVHTWSTDASKINSTYSRIAKAAGIAFTPPASCQISQENLRKWEKSAREASTFCNQAAAFNRCLYKVQDNMQSQIKTLKSELSRGKSSGKFTQAIDELQFLQNFNASITQSMAKTLEHLTDFVFVTVANTTLARRDAYLSPLKMGIKPNTLAALYTGPLHIATLFPDSALKQAKQDISNFENKGPAQSGKKGRYHPYERSEKRGEYKKPDQPAWKNIGNRGHNKRGRGKASYYSSSTSQGPAVL